MSAITDLTWAQLQAASNASGFITWDATDGIILKPALLTSDSYGALTDGGVVEFLYKLHLACSAAQSSVNQGAAIGDRLASFPAFSASAPVGGMVTVTQQIVSKIPLNPNSVVGTNN